MSIRNASPGFSGLEGRLALVVVLLACTGCALIVGEEEAARMDRDGDGLFMDLDCDDSDPDVLGPTTWYQDQDGDGYGAAALTTWACEQPSGYSENGDDCDDSLAEVGAPLDWHLDQDSDGFGRSELAFVSCTASPGYLADGSDCDDGDPDVNPLASEVCDGVDNDCDGETDGAEAEGAQDFHVDQDGDGYGDPEATQRACEQPSGCVTQDLATDCDDADAEVHPGHEEVCDGVDNDCDELVDHLDDDGPAALVWYLDADRDGYGDPAVTQQDCFHPSGYVADSSDCDDSSYEVHPAARERCNGVDDDCDDDVDEAGSTGESTWCLDADGDGYGASAYTTSACDPPSSYVADCSDCDDSAYSTNPGAAERCNGVDDDCDDDLDDLDDDLVDALTWAIDYDGDGYGSSDLLVLACEQPSGFVSSTTDCDDGDDAIHPGASEICNDADDDCDGLTDDDDSSRVDAPTWYIDGDGDGYGTDSYTFEACDQPTGFVGNDQDCDDSDASVSPDATEIYYDGVDSDCDEGSDYDADGDGYDSSDYGGDDCDDADAATSPRALDWVDGWDTNCDGTLDQMQLADAWAIRTGEDEGHQVGQVVDGGKDVNGDGLSDILVTTRSNGCDGDTAYIELGPVSRSAGLIGADVKLTPPAGIYGSSCLGSGASLLRDINGDGIDEVLVGDRVAGASESSNEGAVYLVMGPITSDMSLDQADLLFSGADSSEQLGYVVHDGGDFSGDGRGDFLMGSSSTIYIVDGAAALADGGPIISASSVQGSIDTGGWGAQLDGGVDVDGDGFDDVLLGVYSASCGSGSSNGAAYLYYGPLTGSLSTSTADASWCGEASSDYAGSAVALVDDLNGDGGGDVVVGAREWSGGGGTGAVYVVFNPSTGSRSLSSADVQLSGVDSDDNAGSALASAGDMNGDGAFDLAVAAYGADNASSRPSGRVYVLLGPLTSGSASLEDADLVALGDDENDHVGYPWYHSMAGAGDTDGDGFDDLIVGAPGHDAGGSNAGAVYLLAGSEF